MRLLSSQEAKQVDMQAMKKLSMSLSLLMENAGRGAFEKIVALEKNLQDKLTVIVAGMGNNGGDALVLARQIYSAGAPLKVFLFGHPSHMTELCAFQYELLETLGVDVTWMDEPLGKTTFFTALPYADLVVDGLVGTGFSGELKEEWSMYIQAINKSRCIYALDIPSGVNADSGEVGKLAVKADYTLAFGSPKQGTYLYPGRKYCGQIISVGLGVAIEDLVGYHEQTELINSELVKQLLRIRSSTDHKGTHGHVLVIGGSLGMLGAPLISSLASVCSGAGKTSLVVPQEIYDAALQQAIPEVMVKKFSRSQKLLYDWSELCDGKDVVAIGPGLGRGKDSQELLETLLNQYDGPLVIDADALYVLGDKLNQIGKRAAPVILTPHPGEFSMLTGLKIMDIEKDRITVARDFSRRYGVVLVLKGAPTVVALPTGEVGVNSSGNSGMGTGGMGDVLTGIIASIWAQGNVEKSAAFSGVYLHGLSADLLASEKPFGYTASDVGKHFGCAIKQIGMTSK